MPICLYSCERRGAWIADFRRAVRARVVSLARPALSGSVVSIRSTNSHCCSRFRPAPPFDRTGNRRRERLFIVSSLFHSFSSRFRRSFWPHGPHTHFTCAMDLSRYQIDTALQSTEEAPPISRSDSESSTGEIAFRRGHGGTRNTRSLYGAPMQLSAEPVSPTANAFTIQVDRRPSLVRPEAYMSEPSFNPYTSRVRSGARL